MAKLSTPFHKCEAVYATTDKGVTPTCGYAAYRRHDGKWLCRSHTRRAKARAARA